ncbi:hypothetical protein Mpsy_1515 [Methanolobus psychrophilus R15]|nr:hypothetical protein Mpsy_1515 [Methanolobus psychrophilus R15]
MKINLTLFAICNIQKYNIYTEYFTEKKMREIAKWMKCDFC